MPTNPLRIAALIASALPPPGSPKWEADMRQVITRGHLAAWILPTAGRSLDAMVDSLVADVIPAVTSSSPAG